MDVAVSMIRNTINNFLALLAAWRENKELEDQTGIDKRDFFHIAHCPIGGYANVLPDKLKRNFIMPQIKSAKKRLKQNETAAKQNSAYKSRMRSSRKNFLAAVEAGDKEKAAETYAAYCSALDKAVKRNVIKRNTSTRSKKRGADLLRTL